MGLRFCSIASGSKGNCIYVASDKCRLLVDIGISLKRVDEALSSLNATGKQIDGILLTHCHSDHISGVVTFVKKYGTEVFAPAGMIRGLQAKMGLTLGRKIIPIEECDFFVGDITVSPFEVSHDVQCLGFSFYSNGAKISVATDLGNVGNIVMSKMAGSDIVLIEANHDEQKLRNNPNYPRYLKERILSNRGHLSNARCGEIVTKLYEGGVKQVILGHLSESNNTPELALSTVKQILKNNFIEPDKDISIAVAVQEKMSAVYEVNVG